MQRDFYRDVRGILLGFYWDAKGFLPGCKGEFYLDFTGMQRDFYRDVRGNFTWILLGCKGIFTGM